MRNHRERTAYNTLQEHYDKLHPTYSLLYADDQRLKRDFEALKHGQLSQCFCHYQKDVSDFNDSQVAEIE